MSHMDEQPQLPQLPTPIPELTDAQLEEAIAVVQEVIDGLTNAIDPSELTEEENGLREETIKDAIDLIYELQIEALGRAIHQLQQVVHTVLHRARAKQEHANTEEGTDATEA